MHDSGYHVGDSQQPTALCCEMSVPGLCKPDKKYHLIVPVQLPVDCSDGWADTVDATVHVADGIRLHARNTVICSIPPTKFSSYDTEMQQLDLPPPWGLPPAINIHKSPTPKSSGKTTMLTPTTGGCMIDSFFDLYVEASTNWGITWYPDSNGPCHLVLAGPNPTNWWATNSLPPFNGCYTNCPASWVGDFGNGIIISNVILDTFTASFPPPSGTNYDVDSFGATLHMQMSTNGGQTFESYSAPANVTMQIRGPSSILLDIQPVTRGLRVFAQPEATYARSEMGTDDANMSWVNASSYPVSYSFTITNMPSLADRFEVNMWFIPVNAMPADAYSDTYVDWNCTNVLAMIISGNNTNYGVWVGYKTNAPSATIFSGPTLAYNYSTTATGVQTGNGTWTLAFTDNNHGSVTGPGLSPVSFTIQGSDWAYFANPLIVYFGVQNNSISSIGDYVDCQRIQITGLDIGSIDDNFATGADYNDDWTVVGADTSGMWLVPADSAWWVNWTTPADGFDAEVNTNGDLLAPHVNWIAPSWYQGYGQPFDERLEGIKVWTLIPTADLPPGQPSVFFRLANPANFPLP